MIARTDREKFAMEAIHKQCEIAGHDPSILKTHPDSWFRDFTMTQPKLEEWKKWFLKEIRSRFKMTKVMAEKEFAFFNLSYGFRLEEHKNLFDPSK